MSVCALYWLMTMTLFVCEFCMPLIAFLLSLLLFSCRSVSLVKEKMKKEKKKERERIPSIICECVCMHG